MFISIQKHNVVAENEAKKRNALEAEANDDEDSQFFKVATKALDRINNRKSIGADSKPGGTGNKTFKSPKAKMPLSVLVSDTSHPKDTVKKIHFVTISERQPKRIVSQKGKRNA